MTYEPPYIHTVSSMSQSFVRSTTPNHQIKSTMANPTYASVLATLKTYPPPLLPPGHAHSKPTTASIASLELHPTLEAALHILNHDLPSAHFLVRKMEAPPAVEGMCLHAILHRIEGDYENSRLWYADVARDEEGRALLGKSWDGGEGARAFVDEVQGLKERGEGDKGELEEKSLREIMNVIGQCEEKFGTERWVDALEAWTKSPEKNQEMKQKMTTGGEGYRKF